MGDDLRKLLPVREDEDHLEPIAHEHRDQTSERLAEVSVQAGEGVVQDEERRCLEQPSRDLDTSRLAIREVVELPVQERRKLQPIDDPFAVRGEGHRVGKGPVGDLVGVAAPDRVDRQDSVDRGE